MKSYKSVDEYIASFPKEVQDKLKEIRHAIKDEAPEVEEKISYGIPTTTLNGKYLVYFAGYKSHVSLYPVTQAVEDAVKQIGKYKSGKGTLQFPLGELLPMSIIVKVIRTRVREHRKMNS